jgi:hypothetical protein
MTKLEAMLEQRGVATPREVSEAIARCQLHGGDLTTSLLQFVNADETALSAALSECYALPAAPLGLLPAPDDAALRSLPREVAERYCCFPLAAGPGRLVLAVAHPFDAALKEELGSTLAVSIEEHIALEVRIRQALARFYGLPLSPRNQRGIARLEGDIEGAGHETPLGLWSDTQLSTLPRPPSDPASMRDSQRPPSVRPRSRNETPRLGLVSAPPPSAERPARRRGSLSLGTAREELARALTRNEVLEIFFAFASQSFEYSALFAVHSSLAEGLDAWGKGADRETVLGIGVPLDLPSSLSEAAESCKVRLTRLSREGIDRTLMADLHRQHNAKALVLPVCLRGRCALLFYADNGEADVVERDIADLVMLAPDTANALGRIILQRKKDAARLRSSDPTGHEGGPDASSAPLAREAAGVSPLPPVAVDPSPSKQARPSSPVAAPAPAGGRTPVPPSADDPVFLLARPHTRSSDAPASSVSSVPKPRVSITLPARIIANRPRLPSVIVDPESADPEASERATRAAAITRAPTQARSSGSGQRSAVPPPADAPRSRPLRDETRVAAAAAITIPAGRSRELDGETSASQPESGVFGDGDAHWAPENEESIGATASAWPPPIMDHSPPPRQAPLTALVPIIIADPPKGRRGYGAVRSTASRGAASSRGGVQRPPSNPAPGLASPTLPSPARAHRADALPAAKAATGVHVVGRAEPGPLGPAVHRDVNVVGRTSPAVATLSDAVVAATAGAAPAVIRAAANGATHSSGLASTRPASSPPEAAPAKAPSSAAALRIATSPVASSSAASPAPHAPSEPPRISAPSTVAPSRASSPTVPAPSSVTHAKPAANSSALATKAPAASPSRPASAAEAGDTPARVMGSATASPAAPAAPAANPAPSAPQLSPRAGSPPRSDTTVGMPAVRASTSFPVGTPAPRLAFAPPASPSIPHAVGSLPAQLAPASTPSTGAGAVTIPARAPTAGSIAPSVTITVAGAAPKPPPSAVAVVSKPASGPAKPNPGAPPPSGAVTSRPGAGGSSTRGAGFGPAPFSPAPSSPALASVALANVTSAPRGSEPGAADRGAEAAADTSGAASARVGAERPAIFPPAPPNAEIEELVERVCQGNLTAVHELANIGAHGLPMMMARFPGPVISERAGPSSRASECGPLLQALAAIGSPAMPLITRSSEHDDARVRRWATLLLGEMPGPEACRAVVQRLADDVPRVHQAALDAARLLLASPAADLFRSTLFEVAEADEAPLTLRLRTLEHVAKLKDSASVPRLIAFLGASMEPIVHKALWALTVVTRHDYGRDAGAWAEFWQTHRNDHRLVWLIDALDEHDPRLRKAAADELREEVGELYGYNENMPQPERLVVQGKLREWWTATGAARQPRAGARSGSGQPPRDGL